MERSGSAHLWSDDELLTLSSAGERVELIDGVLHDMSPGGAQHGAVIARLTGWLVRYADEQRAGTVFGAETGYRLDRANCLAPDISFVCAGRLTQLLPDPEKFLMGAPDLAVEVLSPSDTWAQAERKVRLYSHHGTRIVWIIDPRGRSVRVYRDAATFQTLTGAASLHGEELLPGLEIPLSVLFPDYPARIQNPKSESRNPKQT